LVINNDHRNPFQHWLIIIIVLTIVTLDQVSKYAIRINLELHESVTILAERLNLIYIENTGAAFGFLSNVSFPFKTTILVFAAIIALLYIAFYMVTLPSSQWLARTGLSCILGGAMGNLIDRVRTGAVVDFIDLYWREWHFWAFNVADTAITVGVIVMIIDLFWTGKYRAS
jgi:signal peptidase II